MDRATIKIVRAVLAASRAAWSAGNYDAGTLAAEDEDIHQAQNALDNAFDALDRVLARKLAKAK